jgi:hypothetical protein
MGAATRTTYAGVELSCSGSAWGIGLITAVHDGDQVLAYELGTFEMAGTSEVARHLCADRPLSVKGVAVGRWMGASLLQEITLAAAEQRRDLTVISYASERRPSAEARALSVAYRLARSASDLFNEMGGL